MLKKVMALILICCFLLMSCSGNVRKGRLLKTEYMPDYSNFVKNIYSFEIEDYPTIDNPTLKLRIYEIPKYKIIAKDHYQKIHRYTEEKMHPVGWIIGLPLALGGLIIGIAKPGNDSDEKEVIGWLGIIASLGGLLIMQIGEAREVEKVDGEIEEERLSNKLADGTPEPVSEKQFIFEFKSPSGKRLGDKVSIRTNSKGIATINLLRIANIYEIPSGVEYITISSTDMKNTLNISCSNWLDPLREITAANMNVRSGPGTNYQIIGKAFRGENYLEIDSRGKWAKINYSTGDGWVYKDLTKKRYAKYQQPYPPELRASLSFHEPSGNNLLDAEETAEVKLNLENVGKGIAFGIKVDADIGKTVPGLKFKKQYDVGQLGPFKNTLITIPFNADIGIPSQEINASITITERNGFGLPAPLRIRFSTQEFQRPILGVDYAIDDFNNNHKVEPLEMVTVTARIQNLGNGVARDVKANLIKGENVFWGGDSPSSFYIGTISSGGYKDIEFTVYTNNRATSIPLTLILKEYYGKYGLANEINLPFNTVQKTLDELIIKGENERPPILPPVPLTADVYINIPTGPKKNRDAIAVVIGNRDYTCMDVPRVDYAINDASIVKEYLVKSLGYKEGNILFYMNATNSELRAVFGAEKQQGRLANMIKEDKSDVFIYYSGHGAPDPNSGQGYFLPTDCCPEDITINGYSLDLFYKNLSKLKPRSLVVAIDACFSGGSNTGMLIKQASPIIIDVSNPLAVNENAIVITSSAGDEISSWYPDKKHGLFTYFFLKGLRGEADNNGNKTITGKELYQYISDKTNGVPYWARRLYNGRKQTPTINGNDQVVIVRLK